VFDCVDEVREEEEEEDKDNAAGVDASSAILPVCVVASRPPSWNELARGFFIECELLIMGDCAFSGSKSCIDDIII
jgi:hypothetical protein